MLDFLLELVLGGCMNCLQAFSALLCGVRDPEAKRLQRRAGIVLLAGFAAWITAVLLIMYAHDGWSLGLLLVCIGLVLVFWAGHEGAKVERIYLAEPPDEKSVSEAAKDSPLS